jgi:hypothetical protein
MIEEKRQDTRSPGQGPAETRQKGAAPQEHKIVLGKVKTDEEARLAAEIEKLRR